MTEQNKTQMLFLLTTSDRDILAKIANYLLVEADNEIDIKIKRSDSVIDRLTIDIADYISIKHGINFDTLCDDVRYVLSNTGL